MCVCGIEDGLVHAHLDHSGRGSTVDARARHVSIGRPTCGGRGLARGSHVLQLEFDVAYGMWRWSQTALGRTQDVWRGPLRVTMRQSQGLLAFMTAPCHPCRHPGTSETLFLVAARRASEHRRGPGMPMRSGGDGRIAPCGWHRFWSVSAPNAAAQCSPPAGLCCGHVTAFQRALSASYMQISRGRSSVSD